jgi:hypothetical protein
MWHGSGLPHRRDDAGRGALLQPVEEELAEQKRAAGRWPEDRHPQVMQKPLCGLPPRQTLQMRAGHTSLTSSRGRRAPRHSLFEATTARL